MSPFPPPPSSPPPSPLSSSPGMDQKGWTSKPQQARAKLFEQLSELAAHYHIPERKEQSNKRSSLFLETFGESESLIAALSYSLSQHRALLWICRDSERQSERMAQIEQLCETVHFLPSLLQGNDLGGGGLERSIDATHEQQGPEREQTDVALLAHTSRQLHAIARTIESPPPPSPPTSLSPPTPSLSFPPTTILADVSALTTPLPLLKNFSQNTLHYRLGESIDPQELVVHLELLGYKSVAQVERQGEFCLRRDLIDLFDAAALEPLRLSFWGDQLEQIHTFHPQSQRSLTSLQEVTIHQAGLSSLLGRDEGPSLLEQLPSNWAVVLDQPDLIESQCIDLFPAKAFSSIASSLQKRNLLFLSQHLLRALDPGREEGQNETSFTWLGQPFPLQCPPFRPLSLSESCCFPLVAQEFEDRGTQERPTEERRTREQRDALLEQAIKEGFELHLFYQTEAEKKRIQRFFQDIQEKKERLDRDQAKAREPLEPFPVTPLSITLHRADLPQALCFTLSSPSDQASPLPSSDSSLSSKKLYFTRFDTALRSEVPLWRPMLRREHTYLETSAQDWAIGDYVVHLKHGIGLYRGIEQKQAAGEASPKEFIRLEYEGRAQLWVPLEQAHLLHRYENLDESPPKVHKIGSTNWNRQLKQAKGSLEGYAKELLELYAKRSVREGFICAEDSEEYREFEEDFPYTLSEDQAVAIEQIRQDLMIPKPMDRLLCGDVGFGKTEVAMRAACKTICDGGHQVVVLAPTTVLALQHYESFSARMKQLPIKIGMLSRMQKTKERRALLKDLAEGRVDLLIGTHRVLSADVTFSRLGLVIVDEEHRFGVRAKEKLKKFKDSINYLSLSATPIPRTLHLSMMGAKELSHIQTAPDDRLPVATIVTPYSDTLIKEALKKELARGGQAFFVHNHIDELYTLCSHFRKLLPSIRIAIVHGQMQGEEIEKIFHAYQNKEIDFLMATTIIETGIDIPNANTLFVYRAHHYGLSDLHQLRGRVGRWNRQAYAYFLTPAQRELSEEAYQRLQALEEHSYLGGGMQLALRDLQIRGCGNILGQEQSGHICNIGFSYYCQLLKQTIKRLQKEKAGWKQQESSPAIALQWPLEEGISEEYILQSSLRLDFHRRLGQCEELEEIEEIFAEMIDRFGPPGELERSLHARLILPYRLAQKAQAAGVHPRSIAAINIALLPSANFLLQILWSKASRPSVSLPLLLDEGSSARLAPKSEERSRKGSGSLLFGNHKEVKEPQNSSLAQKESALPDSRAHKLCEAVLKALEKELAKEPSSHLQPLDATPKGTSEEAKGSLQHSLDRVKKNKLKIGLKRALRSLGSI